MKNDLKCMALSLACLAVGFVAGHYVGTHTIPYHTNMLCKMPQNNVQNTKALGTYRVTAYCTCAKCCGQFADGITASGRPAKGLIVAAPPEIPFGMRLAIPGYSDAKKPALVADRGGAIKGKRLDLLFPSHKAALEWGVKYLEIEQIL